MLNRAQEWWGKLGRNNQMIVGLTALAIVVATIGFVSWARTPEFQPLFSNLSAQDANAITEKLSEAGVPYRMSQNSTAIEVPAQMHDEWQMKLVGAGLPSDQSGKLNSGDDILNKASLSDTTDMEQLRMRRSMEERVSRSIMTLDQVANATVHYAPADNSPFVPTTHDAKASVLVTPKSGQNLSDGNVRAIVRYLQMSCPGLTEKDISVVDSHGDLLWDPANTSGTGSNERFKQQQELALAKRADLQSMLDHTIGPHKTVVSTSYELNSDERTEHKVLSGQGAVLQKQSTTEELNGQGQVNRGAVGAAGNVAAATVPGAAPPVYQATTGDNTGKYKAESTVQSFNPDSTTVDTKQAPGRIEKLTVSVLLDSKAVKPEELQTTIATIKQTVATNIGLDAADTTNSRQVSVAALPFDRSEEEAANAASEKLASAENNRKLLTLLVPFVIMIVALFLLARSLRRPQPRIAPGTQLALAGAGAGGLNLLSGEGGETGTLALDADGNPLPGQKIGNFESDKSPLGLSSSDGLRTFEVIEEAFDSNLESILHLARTKPDMVSALVKGWINEDLPQS